jgi:hypothetical protein
VAPILHHNAIDILTLACLTAIVPWAFRSPAEAPLAHGAEMVGLGRWLRRAERHEDALQLFRRAIEKGLREELLFRTLWDVGLSKRSWAGKAPPWRPLASWPRAGISTGWARWRSWPSIMSIGNGTTPWPWSLPSLRCNMKSRKDYSAGGCAWSAVWRLSARPGDYR